MEVILYISLATLFVASLFNDKTRKYGIGFGVLIFLFFLIFGVQTCFSV